MIQVMNCFPRCMGLVRMIEKASDGQVKIELPLDDVCEFYG